MIPDHLKPSMTYTPAEPRKVLPPGEEGVPLHRIDRQLWPGMRTTSGVGDAKSQAGWAAESAVPAESLVPIPDPNLNPNLNPAPLTAGSATFPNTSSFAVTNEAVRTDKDVYPTGPNLGGRPRAITPQRRMQLLHILRRGQSRRHAAERMGIDAASITRAIRRDPRLAVEVMAAEEEGQMFLEIWDRLYSLQETVLELKPIVSTPQLEREKAYLISCGLPAAYVCRLRMRTMDDPPPVDLPPETEEDKQRHREIRVKPWKRGWRKKRARRVEREELWW